MSADPVRWFDQLGTCRCGKPAVGTLRGPGNESFGIACRRCGEARVNKAERERAAEGDRVQVKNALLNQLFPG